MRTRRYDRYYRPRYSHHKRDLRPSIGFIDILFSVVVGVGFRGISARPWFRESWDVFDPKVAFEIIGLLVAFTTVVLSWYGYHRSISERPIQLENIFGRSRFFIDIGILTSYWFLIEKSSSLWFILLGLGIIWSLYMVWVVFEELEHSKTRSGRKSITYRHLASNFGFLLAFWMLFSIYHFIWGIKGSQMLHIWDWIFLALALVAVVVYRVTRKGYA